MPLLKFEWLDATIPNMPSLFILKFLRPPIVILALAEFAAFVGSTYLAVVADCTFFAICDVRSGPVLVPAIIYSTVMFACLIAMGLYQFHQRMNHREVIARLMVGLIVGSLALAVIFFAIPAVAMSRSHIGISVVIAGTALLVIRFLFLRSIDENAFRLRTLIYGCGNRAESLHDLRRKADRRGFKIVACVPAPGDTKLSTTGWNIVRDRSLRELCESYNVDQIVIAMDDRRGNLPIRELLHCRFRGIEIVDLLEFLERETGKIWVDVVNPGWLIFSEGFNVSKLRSLSKRVLDALVASCTLLVTWPIFLIVAVAIKIEDGLRAPVFYRQMRVGRHGREFLLTKFRSMCVDAEADGKAVWADVNDSRISKVGRVIRKYRVDELPQIMNVLSGRMSWVGPRPERPEFVRELSNRIPYYDERHTVHPGITGWAQLRYAYGSSEEDAVQKLQFDLYYIKNQSVLLDLVILLQTLEVIVWGKGAR